MRRLHAWSFLIVSCLGVPASASFVNFESQHVHPIAFLGDPTSPGSGTLFVVNTPDNRLAVFDVSGGSLSLAYEVMVGLEPVSVAVRDAGEVWVANHISDTVSIVDLTTRNVRATLQVGDEPTDVVFAGPMDNRRAFVCVSQEDAVKIYDPDDLTVPPVVVPIFASDPQALCVSNDGNTVYAAVFESGNQTSIAGEQDVLAHGGLPEPNPPGRPDTGIILSWNGTNWEDEAGTSYADTHAHRLPDHDVAVLDATVPVPSPTYLDHLGTLNFNIAVHPTSDEVWVTNTEALNHIRFEPNLRGQFLRTRVSIVDPTSPGTPNIVDLNPHIDYSTTPGPQNEIDLSLSQPGGMAFDSNGIGYMSALGSAKVARLDASGTVTGRIDVGEGPSGLALNETSNQLYVVNRFDNSVSVVNTNTLLETATHALFDPSPDVVKNGRRFLYDGRLSSGHGDLACASCHAGGHFDNIAWDLGDPNGSTAPPPEGQLDPLLSDFHPMKGPMTTQTLRGLDGTQPFHWRGDRDDFEDFNPAFASLMGRDVGLADGDVLAFKAFVFTIRHGPNPNQNLDRSFADAPPGMPSAERGRQLFSETRPLDGPFFCSTCHALPTGTNGQLINGMALLESQDMKTPQLRNLYEKTGYDAVFGNQKRGFGFLHDGSIPTLFDFLHFPGFSFANDDERRDMEAFLHAFDTGMAPAVGAQLTVDASNESDGATSDWLNTMIARNEAGDCDLIAKGLRGGKQRGWVYDGSGWFRSDVDGEALVGTSDLLGFADTGAELTFTGAPPGCGVRLGIDRDEDGFGDRTEIFAGSDPADPASTPVVSAAGDVGRHTRRLGRISTYPNPVRDGVVTISFEMDSRSQVHVRIFDAGGRYVATVMNDLAGPGPVHVRWDGTDANGRSVSSGVYFSKVQSGRRTRSGSVLVLR